MTTRRDFLSTSIKAASVAGLAPLMPVFGSSNTPQQRNSKLGPNTSKSAFANKFMVPDNYGLGGVAIGNAFRPTTDQEAHDALEAAWNAGVRFYDTSPYYGFGLSERRFGHFLHSKNREDYVLATKVGRVMKASKDAPEDDLWKDPSPFGYEYDFTASGVRRSIEDSLQRMGVDRIDIVFIHDLSPENEELDDWKEYFKIAENGAMPELIKMREEGIIKGWGYGVNRIDPILRAIEVSDPDICLTATQYSLIEHKKALNELFPVCEKNNVELISGAPYNSGFIAGIDRYNYSDDIPQEFYEKRTRLNAVAQNHGIDIKAAALQFCAAPQIMSAVIPGTRYASQARENVDFMKVNIPSDFWQELKSENLIEENAPTPG